MAGPIQRPRASLEDRRPAFLNLLDSDPRSAMAGLYDFVQRFFVVRPPSVYYALSASDREDWPSKVFVHLIEDKFRRLRLYVSGDKPFAAWLSTVSRNLILEWIRRQREEVELPPDLPGGRPSAPHLDAATQALLNQCLKRLSPQCRLHMETEIVGLKPRDIVELCGLSSEEAKRLSDAKRHCFNVLRQYLVEAGYVPEPVAISRGPRSEKAASDSFKECQDMASQPSVGAQSTSPEGDDVR